MLKHWKRALSLLAVAAAVGLVSAGLALGKKPPKPPPPPPEPPPVEYSITFLGTLPGDTTSEAYDVNILGEVVGWSVSADGEYRAFAYNAFDGMVDLNSLIDPASGWDLIVAYGINDAGQIAGLGKLNGDWRAYRLTPGNGETPAVIENLGTLGGIGSEPYAVNDHGDVVGMSQNANGTRRAFVWTDQTGMVDIGDLGGGGNASAQGINNFGQVTGTSRILLDNGGTQSRAFLYTPGVGMEDLGDLGADPNRVARSCGYDINDAGHVTGEAGNAPKFKGWLSIHAFLYTDHMIDLGTLGGWYSKGRGVNSSGHVVGVSQENVKGDYDVGFLYIEEFGMLKLEDLIPGFEGPIEPRKINDFGQICGTADGEAILLTPVEP